MFQVLVTSGRVSTEANVHPATPMCVCVLRVSKDHVVSMVSDFLVILGFKGSCCRYCYSVSDLPVV